MRLRDPRGGRAEGWPRVSGEAAVGWHGGASQVGWHQGGMEWQGALAGA